MKSSKTALANFVKSPFEGVLTHPERKNFDYSDGKETEERILEILRSCQDLSVASPELQARIIDWPTEYHFTDVRSNLMRHLGITAQMRVLELGAGCGAITRFLGETGCELTSIEGSLMRSRCARERVRDLKNVAVYCSNFQDVDFKPEYDAVTLIGVLEYAPIFFEGNDPFAECLRLAKSALRPGGKLIIAIENQLGLKYFSGATEDHLGTQFSGIENLYAPKGVQTMGRLAIRRKLFDSGFESVEFQYPFPDYKLPAAIIFEHAFEQPKFSAAEIIRHLPARDYSNRDTRAVEMSLVWPVLEENGMVGDLSNSFLVLASERGLRSEASPKFLALTYSTGRDRCFQTRTDFILEQDSGIRVRKSLLHDAPPRGSSLIRQNLGFDRYTPGVTLHSQVVRNLRDRNAVGFIVSLKRWIHFLSQHATGSSASLADQRLPADFFDCLPGNLVDTGGELVYIDREWELDTCPTISFLLLRYLTNLAFGESSKPRFEACFPGPQMLAIARISADLNVPLRQAIVDEFEKLANLVNAEIFPNKPAIKLRQSDLGLGGSPRPVITSGPAQTFVAIAKRRLRKLLS